MSQHFDILEVGLNDILFKSGLEFVESKYRQSRATLLLCRFPALKHTCIIRCAPIGRYFCGLKDYWSFWSALYTYTSEKLIPDDAFYDAFIQELKKAKITKDMLPRELFASYAEWGAYGAAERKGFGKKFDGKVLNSRAAGVFVPDEMVFKVIQYWESQLDQMQSRALYDAPEDLNAVVANPNFSEVPWASRISYPSPDYDSLVTNVFVSPSKEKATNKRLAELIDALEQGETNVLQLFPLHMVRLVPSVFIPLELWRVPAAEARARMRARVIRLLGFVWHYPSVLDMISNLQDRQLTLPEEHKQAVDLALSELNAYVQDMRERYPAIEQNPLA